MANSLINQSSINPSPAPVEAKPDTRIWLYKGQESRLFNSKDDVPAGEDWREAPYETAEEPAADEAPKKVKKAKKAEAEDAAVEATEPDHGDSN